MILLDTHALIWHAQGDRQLGSRTRKMIEAKSSAGEVSFSALTIWELALLASAQRIRLDLPCETWRMRLLGRGLREVPVDGEIAWIAAGYRSALIDPIDCMLAATAVRIGAVFITAETRILEWDLGPQLHDASR
ncbi:MAG TPA: type II toxin-antitoxin system VapC family toxin [Xanthomonadales bacterium]|nr:type II toxin-antitoxin system VapC family toxin [Xanthomonadales bacterium]